MKKHHKIAIAGAGGIGRAVALILAELSEVAPDIYLGDIYTDTAEDAAEWAISSAGSSTKLSSTSSSMLTCQVRSAVQAVGASTWSSSSKETNSLISMTLPLAGCSFEINLSRHRSLKTVSDGERFLWLQSKYPEKMNYYGSLRITIMNYYQMIAN